MANQNLIFGVLLRLNDQMSRGIHAAMQTVERDSRSATQAMNHLSESANRVHPQGVERLNAELHATATAAQGTASALGGIASVENRLRPLGIERLNASLRTAATQARTTLSTLSQLARVGAQAGGAVAAGGYVLMAEAKAPMAYGRRLALLSNTANSNLDKTGRIAAIESLNAGIKNAVKSGGGTPDQALDALNTLAGSGAFGNANQSMALLPMLQKFATGTGATGNDLAKILIAAKQNMSISDADMPAMLSKAIKAGQLGGFELPDMAKWLPQQMALASSNGMKSMPGFEMLLAANQASKITSGTTDEAGNNVVNLLSKMNSQDTVKDFKKQGIDLTGSLVKGLIKGKEGSVLPLDGFVKGVEYIANKNKDYTTLRKQASAETDTDKKANLSARADLLMQSAISKVVQDREAQTALLALIQQKEKYQAVKAAAGAEKGAEGTTSYDTVASTLDYKSEQLGNQKAFAAIDLLGMIDEPLGRLLDKTNELAEANPKLTLAAVGTTAALTALAAAAGGSALIGAVTGGGAGALAARVAPLVAPLVGPLVAGTAVAAGVYGIGTLLHDHLPPVSSGSRFDEIIKAVEANRKDEANRPLNVQLNIDGREIANTVNRINGQEARRN